jgi:hypothetical protein
MRQIAVRRIAGQLATAAVACTLLGLCAAAASSSVTQRGPMRESASAALATGSPGHPRGVRLTTTFGWQGLTPSDQPTLTQVELWFPKGSVYNGAKYPKCSENRLDRLGVKACPKGSIMGHGTGTAFADTVITRPTITVVNGGARAVYFYTVLNNPARVQTAVVGHVTRLHGRFVYHLSATIPPELQIVAGVPIELTSLTITAGRGKWLALSAAPAGVKVVTHFNNGAVTSYQLWVQNT